ncbi:hypothetical protein [Salinicola rhizosphaerae]|uniref:EthD domain-containing protein n=1 Tax=Salinicola rhizosphaerae TaxID=1443141 RepID=A0ABQ3EDV5_9GAMM|nr:hypothetical protein [Salinicola rhizosphaerae]GHB34651.1 hypothetical protein GCM10009038_37280 [Salinicola rhizosphaerae]
MTIAIYELSMIRLDDAKKLEVIDGKIRALSSDIWNELKGSYIYRRISDTSGPEGLQFPKDMQQTAEIAFPWPGHDVVLATKYGQMEKLVDSLGLHSNIERCDEYIAERRVVLDKGSIREGYPSNGISYLYGLYFHNDLMPSAIDRMWGNHPETVERVHIGVGRYTQWWIKDREKDAASIGGVAELHFPTEEDLVKRLFDSERGQKEVVTDQKGFMKGGMPRVFSRQYVI